MNAKLKISSIRFALILAAGLAIATVSGHAQSATATIFGVVDGANYDYTLTLHNSGSVALQSFWYGWTTGGNNLPSNPTTPGNSLGWGNTLFFNSIKYTGSSLTALAAGQSATFTFTSSSTPAQMTTGIAGESVAYVGGITSTQNNPGDSTAVFSPVLVPAPEPSAASLLAVGALGLLAMGWRRTRA